MRKILYSLLFILSIFVWSDVKAQSKTYQKALSAYQAETYFEAAELLKKAYAEEGNRQTKTEINFQLGECYRFMGNYSEAENYYNKAITMRYPEPVVYFYLAEMLKAQGKYDEAINAYNNFKAQSPSDRRADIGIESCNMAKQWQNQRSRYTIENMTAVNSKWNDFNPAIVKKTGGQMVFTSTREEATGKDIDGWSGESFSDIFYTEQDRKSLRNPSLTPVWSVPVPLGENINSESNEGGIGMNSKRSMMYYTVCGVDKSKTLGCKIYKARKQGAGWSTPELQEVAADSVLVFHPALSIDEKTMYFVSNMDGGYGGFDIYMTQYDKRKRSWGDAVNLGPEVNSEGNEMFPSIGLDGNLYFASNGHVGMGGYDLFVSENRDGVWVKAKNMMPPFNSSADDITLYWEDAQCKSGFFASDREGGLGGDDIYRVFRKRFDITIKGGVMDAKTGAIVQEAEVVLTGSNGRSFTTYTDVNGRFVFTSNMINEEVNYSISMKKEGYLNKNMSATTVGIPLSAYTETDQGYSYAIELNKELDPIRKPIDLPKIEFDLGSAELRLDSKDALDFLLETLEDNPEIVIELRAHTDYRGSDKLNLELSQRRAQSCVNYLLSKGVDSLRLKPLGMGENDPYVLEKAMAPFKAGDVMTPGFIDALKKNEHKEMAHQLNRRVDFKVVSSDYKPFAKKVIAAPADSTTVDTPTEDVEEDAGEEK